MQNKNNMKFYFFHGDQFDAMTYCIDCGDFTDDARHFDSLDNNSLLFKQVQLIYAARANYQPSSICLVDPRDRNQLQRPICVNRFTVNG